MSEKHDRTEKPDMESGITDEDMARIRKYLEKPPYVRHISDLEKSPEK